MTVREFHEVKVMRFLCLFTIWPLIAYSQNPVIFPNGVVNAASYEPANTTTQNLGPFLSRGSIVSIFGQNLGSSTQTATTIPLPIELAGTSVMLGSVAAPLFYVSSGQINFQMPDWGGSGGIPPLVVSNAGGASDPYSFGYYEGASALGSFTLDASGCGQGAVLNVGSNGTVSANSASNSISPGGYVSVFGTGVDVRAPADGAPTPMSPLFTTPDATESTFDFGTSNGNVALWAGLAPGLIGVAQINLQVPSTTREGCAVPVQFTSDFFSISQPATISVRQGGGPCVDPPSAGYGQITWEKTVTTSATGAASETDLLTMSLQASPGKQAPPPATFSEGGAYTDVVYFGQSCPIPGYRSLGGGTVSAQGPGFGPVQASVVPVQQGQISGLTVYQAALPSGSIQPGSFTVAASGGADAGAFQTNVQIGSGIQVTTALAGRVISPAQPLVVNWTGGDPNTWVTITLLEQRGGFADVGIVRQARTSDGSITVGYACIDNPPPLGPSCSLGVSGMVEVILEVTPDPAQTPSFSAPGLSLGGQSLWKYTYRFEGVNIPEF
jgi:uncharacterized protein (TIGR03437 family)